MIENLYERLCSLSACRGLLELEPMRALRRFLQRLDRGKAGVEDYCRVFYALMEAGHHSLCEYLLEHLRYDESPFARSAARGELSGVLEQAARHDMAVLNNLANLPCSELKGSLAAQCSVGAKAVIEALPEWDAGGSIDFDELRRFYAVNGCGWFARYRAFVWQEGQLRAVPNPDYLRKEELWGYERERGQVVENTRALMAGRQVNNVLLYGASGTGKSATVKAMLSEFEGLRLVEVPREALRELPHIVRLLGNRPQKFIVFIDDLSFDREDQTFSSLKTILEGGLEPRPENVAVYCTSNRRHLVRQNFSDRSGDEIDANETIQDKTALAERFGLRVLFRELNKARFLDMAGDLARARGVELEPDTLKAEAVKWDVRHPSRTPRSAHQFAASMVAKYGR